MRPKLILIDNAADVYGGDENSRAMVRQFITLLRNRNRQRGRRAAHAPPEFDRIADRYGDVGEHRLVQWTAG